MINDNIRKIMQRRADTPQRNRSVNKFIYLKLRFKIIIYFLAGFKLKKLSAKCKSFDDYLNLIASFSFSIFNLTAPVLIWTSQRKSELTKFCKIVAKFCPKSVFEIGTANGGTLLLLTKLSAPDALIGSIDLFGGIKKSYREIFFQSYATQNQEVFYIQKNSHSFSALLELKKKLKNKKIDLLFIDGDHSYDGVKKDFEMYAPLVKKNGIIAFHDIVKCSPEFAPNV
ncbi:MAG: class I SAM-dependent methyltransferase, partial [Promethearchaeota archaeon]